ncbi:hypothetical protein LVJ94_03090 [Pendulispora rubella]|uniref:Type I-B CRISPR Cas8b C-terminal domain-containing protein n=1 Tax=Pendulispora rubella TaxID=2741070 RepID=A0ABZ2L5L9_9BACT
MRDHADSSGNGARNARERILREAHATIELCDEQDFVDHFAAMCRPAEVSNDDFQTLARALAERPHEVRITMMLALLVVTN